MAKRAEVSALAMDPNHKVPVVLLRLEDDERFVPIWIGLMEASAILLAIEGVEVQRPMTHDLLCRVADTCGARVTRVEVNDLRDGTYFAELTVQAGDEVHVIDSRPSDAIAIALRTEAPIYVHDRVLDKIDVEDEPGLSDWSDPSASDSVDPNVPPKAGGEAPSPGAAAEGEQKPKGPRVIPTRPENLETDEDEMRKILEKLSPDDFKYKM
jgi:uncharacterized protein